MSDKPQTRLHLRSANAWKRWEMATFDTVATQPGPASFPSTPGPGPEEIRHELEQLRDAVRTRAHAQGHAAGHTEGLAAGQREGQEAGQKQGYEAGFSDGLAAGRAAGREQAEREIGQLHTLAESCADALGSIENEMGQALISLAIQIAEQVLRSTLDRQPEKILDLVRDMVLSDLDKDAVLRLRVNPADLALVDDYLSGDPGVKNWRIKGDDAVERGGCIAETALGTIDATLETRWQRVVSSLGKKPTARRRSGHVAGK